jgi:hypothetical protein
MGQYGTGGWTNSREELPNSPIQYVGNRPKVTVGGRAHVECGVL